MDRRVMDPFQFGKLPEVIEEYLDDGETRCIAFNRRGTVLAGGCANGHVLIWDMDTRGVVRRMRGHAGAVSALSWARDGRALVTGSEDGTVISWDLLEGKEDERMGLPGPVAHVSVHERRPHLALATTRAGTVHEVDLEQGSAKALPSVVPTESASKASALAIYGKDGEMMFVGAATGTIAVLDAATRAVLDVVRLPGGATPLGLSLDRRGGCLLVNCGDRTVRTFAAKRRAACGAGLPLAAVREKLVDLPKSKTGSLLHEDQSKAALTLEQELSNAVDRCKWACTCLSGDREHVVGAAAGSDAHHLYVWVRDWGKLDRILEGPRESGGCSSLAWHPIRNQLYSVGGDGKVFCWAQVYHENWSAFAPGFTELEENLEYVEQETEFDVNEQLEEEARRAQEADAEAACEEGSIDIESEDEVPVFSSDDETDEAALHHLPVDMDKPPGADEDDDAEGDEDDDDDGGEGGADEGDAEEAGDDEQGVGWTCEEGHKRQRTGTE